MLTTYETHFDWGSVVSCVFSCMILAAYIITIYEDVYTYMYSLTLYVYTCTYLRICICLCKHLHIRIPCTCDTLQKHTELMTDFLLCIPRVKQGLDPIKSCACLNAAHRVTCPVEGACVVWAPGSQKTCQARWLQVAKQCTSGYMLLQHSPSLWIP